MSNINRCFNNGLFDLGEIRSCEYIVAQIIVSDILAKEHLRFINKVMDEAKNRYERPEINLNRWEIIAEIYNCFKSINLPKHS